VLLAKESISVTIFHLIHLLNALNINVNVKYGALNGPQVLESLKRRCQELMGVASNRHPALAEAFSRRFSCLIWFLLTM